jgi:hypothetical protein
MYRFTFLEVTYTPTISEYKSTGALYMGFEPDIDDYTSISSITAQYIENQPVKVEGKTSTKCVLRIPGNLLQPAWRYVSVGKELRLNNTGALLIGTTDTSGGALGDVSVTYTIEMKMPDIMTLAPNILSGGKTPASGSTYNPFTDLVQNSVPSVSDPYPASVGSGSSMFMQPGFYHLHVDTSYPNDANAGLTWSLPFTATVTNLWNIVSTFGSMVDFLINVTLPSVVTLACAAANTNTYSMELSRVTNPALPNMCRLRGVDYHKVCQVLGISRDGIDIRTIDTDRFSQGGESPFHSARDDELEHHDKVTEEAVGKLGKHKGSDPMEMLEIPSEVPVRPKGQTPIAAPKLAP